MKPLWKVITIILSIFAAIAELVEFLIVPALFVLIGILNQLPWQYYAIFIGGYFALFLIGELLIRLIFKALNKKYASRFAAKVEKIIARFSKEQENSTNLPTERN